MLHRFSIGLAERLGGGKEWMLQVLAVQEPAACREHYGDKDGVGPNGLPGVTLNVWHIEITAIYCDDFVVGVFQDVLNGFLDCGRFWIDEIERVNEVIEKEFWGGATWAEGEFAF